MLYDVSAIHENNLLPTLLDLLASTQENIVISRDGTPVAALVPYGTGTQKPRIGVAAGKLDCPADIDFCNDTVEKLFSGDTK